MQEKTIIHVWITKYALTQGIFEAEAVLSCEPGMIEIMRSSGNIYFHDKDWHTDLESAKSRAREMRQKKHTSLKKQLAALEKLIVDNELL